MFFKEFTLSENPTGSRAGRAAYLTMGPLVVDRQKHENPGPNTLRCANLRGVFTPTYTSKDSLIKKKKRQLEKREEEEERKTS